MSSNNKSEEVTCYCCGHTYDKEDIKIYKIHERDFNSHFAWIDADIPLCKECQKDIEEDWFSEESIQVNYGMVDEYIYPQEEDLFDFVCSFPLEYQEKIFNQGFAFSDKDRLTPEEWMEQQKKVLKSIYGYDNDENIEKENEVETCDFCKDLLDDLYYDEPCNIPWYEGGIWCSENNDFYLIPRLDGEQVDSVRPYIEIEYCPKCSRKLKI